MSRYIAQGPGNLLGARIPTTIDTLRKKGLPEAYLKFYKEWQEEPSPVHFIPKEGRFERNPLTGEVRPIQNVPVPVRIPPEMHTGIWGGEFIIKGFQKRNQTRRRVPHFWMPNLKTSVVHSKILDKHMSVIITNRTIDLIHQHYGFDKYLLETKANDLTTLVALKLKKKILSELQAGCPTYNDRPAQQKDILDEFRHFIDDYTPDELDWFGLTVGEAMNKRKDEIRAANIKVPLKHEYRQRLIQQLKEAAISNAEVVQSEDGKTILDRSEKSNWLSKINPFSKNKD